RKTKLGPQLARVSDGSGPVRRVRAGQFDRETTRVVIELADARTFDVHRQGGEIVVTFSKAAVATTPKAPEAPLVARIEAPKPAEAPANAREANPPPQPEVPIARREERLQSTKSSARPIELEERIARRYATDDWAGIVALYAANMPAIRRDADATTRAAVVDALRALGLTYSAKKLLGPASSNEAPALRVVRAEMTLADGDVQAAVRGVAGLDDAAVDPALVPHLRALEVRLALAQGDVEAAAGAIGNRAAPDLRAEVAEVALRAGRTASERRACSRAVVAYRQALEADGGRTARAAAGAGLVRAALACQNPEATMTGLGVLAESSHPLLRRAAALLAATRVEEKQHAKAEPARDGGG
ncbi:MAG: AMIN domain-containing protein, partial [Candidatus Binatia bacterium]